MLSMKVIKKPVEVDAWKLDSSIFLYEPLDPSVPEWARDGIKNGKLKFDEVYNDWSIISLEGLMVAKDGDYVIRGVKGELYPCRGDIFEETYEIVKGQKMSIIIKGEEMPKCCAECPCLRHDNWNGNERYQCNVKLITFGYFDDWIFEKCPNWCPLEEVKEDKT